MASRKEMRIAFDQLDRRPTAVLFEPEEILMKCVVPASPGVPEIMGGQVWAQSAPSDGSTPSGLYLAATLPPGGVIRFTSRGSKHWTFVVWQISQLGNRTRW